MESNTRKPLHPLMWIAGIVLIVFCSAGAAAFMGWIPGSASKPSEPGLTSKLDKPKTTTKTPVTKTPVAAICAHCGVVQSVHEVNTKGEGSAIGVVGGAVVGGVLGNQVGHGDGRKVATVIGAVGGAVAGNEIEKHVKSTKSYEVTVRFDDGSSRVITEPDSTTWRAGDKVKMLNGVLQSNA
jgi:outer membrane lipoprotein SlyB